MLAGPTVLARAAGHAGVEEHTVSFTHLHNPIPAGGHHAGSISAQNVWHGEVEPGKAAQGPKIQPIERRGFEIDQDIVGTPDVRGRHLYDLEPGEISVFVKRKRFHAVLSRACGASDTIRDRRLGEPR